jgi:hypothetical protein
MEAYWLCTERVQTFLLCSYTTSLHSLHDEASQRLAGRRHTSRRAMKGCLSKCVTCHAASDPCAGMRPRTRAAPATPPCTPARTAAPASTTIYRRPAQEQLQDCEPHAPDVSTSEARRAPWGTARPPAPADDGEEGPHVHVIERARRGSAPRRGALGLLLLASGVGVKASFSANTSHLDHPGETAPAEAADPVQVRRLQLRRRWRPRGRYRAGHN